MILRWIYSTWRFLLKTIGLLLLFVVVIAGLCLLTLQLPASKDYIRASVEERFAEQFAGTIEIESITGFIPFNTELSNVILYSPEDPFDKQFSSETIYVSMDLWDLIRGNINVTALEINSPNVLLSRRENNLLLSAIFKTDEPGSTGQQLNANRFFNRFSVFAPNLTIVDGRVEADSSISFPEETGINTPVEISDLDAELFLESTENQQFIDITSLTAKTSDAGFPELSVSGQFFNDGEFLELNSFVFSSDQAVLDLSAVASPVNLYGENPAAQLQNASYQLDIQRIYVQPQILHRINPGFSGVSSSIDIEGLAEGTLDSLFIDNLQLSADNSYLLADGMLSNLTSPSFGYELTLNNLVLSDRDMQAIASDMNLQQANVSAYGIPTVRGSINGTLNQITAGLDLQTDRGGASIDGTYTFEDRPSYSLKVELDSLDISPFLQDSLGSSVLRGQITATGTGIDADADVQSDVSLSGSRISGLIYQQLTAGVDLSSRSGIYRFGFQNGETNGRAEGRFRLGETDREFSTEAILNRFDITDYVSGIGYETTDLNGRISASIQGNSADNLFGRISIEMNESVIDGDTLRPHQLYADIDEPGGENRTLRMTSSFFDANLTGTIYPGRIGKALRYWRSFLSERIQDELFFSDRITNMMPDENQETDSTAVSGPPLDLSLRATAKDLQLLRAYIPRINRLSSSGTVSMNVNATRDALSMNGSFYDDSLTIEGSSFSDLGLSFTSIVNRGETIRNNTFADLQVNSSSVLINNTYTIEGISTNVSLRDSVITLRQKIDNALENLSFLSETTTLWGRDQLTTTVDTLTTGSPDYSWRVRGEPVVEYFQDKSLRFNNFILESRDDFFELDGTFSTNAADSVNYSISNFSLGRISELIGGRVQFEGILDGEFTTRSLTEVPSIQGDLSVSGGRINGRLVGDVTLQSRFNPETDRFDTSIRLLTDPEKYPDYIASNDGVGQDLRFDGYFRAPDDDIETDEDLFYFDVDLREIDMWIVTAIVPKIITEMEGSASGRGFIRGTLDDYDFETTFNIDDVYGRPFFTNVPYTLDGNLRFNRSDGLIFNEILMDDQQGGTGILTGQVDLDDFSPLNILDLRVKIDNMRFMNNEQDPNVPFFADLSGTGTAILEGTSEAPVIRSATPIVLSSNSRISIPLQEETELEESRRFIQFVESFEGRTPLQRLSSRTEQDTVEDNDDTDLTFVELFTMNMQFVANDPIDVQLIFDPVTNDILTASGTGQIRLILDDQDFSMFGRFNISGGEYQFVGGDIIRRRFNIQDGGSINWQGDLLEANLDVTANYRARPDISTLLPAGANFQRIPIELVLQIGGTISELTNEFYFQIPGGIEGTQDPAITAQINRINQNEDAKVLQAFGILLTGNFVPSDQLQNPESGNITGTNAIVNPFFSSQIINPLLSNQINSLLRSDITFDVDFNLNAFNEVDLGVALRLFDDRIVLRREGQITGETEVGDLGATYRINRTFSLTAFHRQDPTLSNRAETETRQTQEMNGVGLEAQFQFNTWQNLKRRISNSFRKLFGLKEKEPEVKDDSDSLAKN